VTTEAVKRKRKEASEARRARKLTSDQAAGLRTSNAEREFDAETAQRPGAVERIGREFAGEPSEIARLLALIGGHAQATGSEPPTGAGPFPIPTLGPREDPAAKSARISELVGSIPSAEDAFPSLGVEALPPPEGGAEEAQGALGRAGFFAATLAGGAGANVLKTGAEAGAAAAAGATRQAALNAAGRRGVEELATGLGGEAAAKATEAQGGGTQLGFQAATEIALSSIFGARRGVVERATKRLTPVEEGLSRNRSEEVGLITGRGAEAQAGGLGDATKDLKRVPPSVFGGDEVPRPKAKDTDAAGQIFENETAKLQQVGERAAARGGITLDDARELDPQALSERVVKAKLKSISAAMDPFKQIPALNEADAVEFGGLNRAMDQAGESLGGLADDPTVIPNLSPKAAARFAQAERALGVSRPGAATELQVQRLDLPATEGRSFSVVAGEPLERAADGTEIRQHFVVDNDGNTLSKHSSPLSAKRQIEFLERTGGNTAFTFNVTDADGEFVRAFTSEEGANRFLQREIAKPVGESVVLREGASLPQAFGLRDHLMAARLGATDPGEKKILSDMLTGLTNDIEKTLAETVGQDGVDLYAKVRADWKQVMELGRDDFVNRFFATDGVKALFSDAATEEKIGRLAELYGGKDSPGWEAIRAATFAEIVDPGVDATDRAIADKLVSTIGTAGAKKARAIYGADGPQVRQSLALLKRSSSSLRKQKAHWQVTIPGGVSWIIDSVGINSVLRRPKVVKRLLRLQDLKNPRKVALEINRIQTDLAELGIGIRVIASADIAGKIAAIVAAKEKARPKAGQGSFGISQPQIDAASAADFADLSLRSN